MSVSTNGLDPNAVVYVPFPFVKAFNELVAKLISSKVDESVAEKSDDVLAPEAADMIHWGMDRFYAKHNTILSHKKPGGKLIFSRKEIQAYLESTKVNPTGSTTSIQEAEEFRIKKLKRA